MERAYGPELTGRVFSDEFTARRHQAIMESLRDVPGLTCPENAPLSLDDIYPDHGDAQRPIWVERYRVGCDRVVPRGLLFALQGSDVVSAPLAPGESAGEPQLYSDTLLPAHAQAMQAAPAAATPAAGGHEGDRTSARRPTLGGALDLRHMRQDSVRGHQLHRGGDGGTVIRVSPGKP